MLAGRPGRPYSGGHDGRAGPGGHRAPLRRPVAAAAFGTRARSVRIRCRGALSAQSHGPDRAGANRRDGTRPTWRTPTRIRVRFRGERTGTAPGRSEEGRVGKGGGKTGETRGEP